MHVGARARRRHDETLVAGLRRVSDMADRLGLVATVRDQAKETFKKLVKEVNGWKCNISTDPRRLNGLSIEHDNLF
jgi:hypothetical protein